MRQSNQINQDKKGNEKNDQSIEKIEQLRNALANLLFPSISKSSSTPRNSKNVNSDQQQQRTNPAGIAKKKRGKQPDKIVPPAKKTKK
jgi:hypothetical protein